MYQVTIFDQHGALLYREVFSMWEAAIKWMFEHRTGKFGDIGNKQYVPTTWSLTRVDGSGT